MLVVYLCVLYDLLLIVWLLFFSCFFQCCVVWSQRLDTLLAHGVQREMDPLNQGR